MALLRIPGEMSARGRTIDATPGQVLLDGGHNSDEIFIIKSGLVQIDLKFAGDAKSIRIAGPGELAGEDAFLGEPYRQRLEALTPARVLALSISDVGNSLAASSWLLGQLTRQSRQSDQERHWMRIHSVDHRVQLHLLALHDKNEGSEIPISQADFAHVVGATRETISTALNRLARSGAIGLSRRSITILKPEHLELQRELSV